MSEESIFLEALKLEGAEREAYLSAECQDNSELRAAVEELLLAHDRTGNILDEQALELDQTLDSAGSVASADPGQPMGEPTSAGVVNGENTEAQEVSSESSGPLIAGR